MLCSLSAFEAPKKHSVRLWESQLLMSHQHTIGHPVNALQHSMPKSSTRFCGEVSGTTKGERSVTINPSEHLDAFIRSVSRCNCEYRTSYCSTTSFRLMNEAINQNELPSLGSDDGVSEAAQRLFLACASDSVPTFFQVHH